MRSSPTTQFLSKTSIDKNMTDSNVFHPQYWLSLDTKTPFEPTMDWMEGSDGKTKMFYDNCESLTSKNFVAPGYANIPIGYNPKDVVVLTNGYCASTCSVFVK